MHHHPLIQEKAVNMSILTVSGPGEFFRVESNEAVRLHSWRSPAKRNLHMLQPQSESSPAKHDLYMPRLQEWTEPASEHSSTCSVRVTVLIFFR